MPHDTAIAWPGKPVSPGQGPLGRCQAQLQGALPGLVTCSCIQGLGFATCPMGIRTDQAGQHPNAGNVNQMIPSGFSPKGPPYPIGIFALEREGFTPPQRIEMVR